MAENPSGERIARLEVQMTGLTNELAEAKDAIKELTAALHEVKGAFRGAFWLGTIITSAMAGLATCGMWIYDRIGGHS
jgi:hypothetical protein